MTAKPQSSAPNPQTNVDRLLKHLRTGSLARQLVEAHASADGATPPADSARAVLLARLAQARGSLDGPKT